MERNKVSVVTMTPISYRFLPNEYVFRATSIGIYFHFDATLSLTFSVFGRLISGYKAGGCLMNPVCRECGKPIFGTARKEFCHDYCRGAFHRRKYRQIAVEEAEDRREARLNGHGTSGEREQAKEVLSRIVGEQQPRFVRRV